MENIKLDKRFIKEGTRIREMYLKSLDLVKSKESEMIKIKDDINKAYEKISETQNSIDKEMIEKRIYNLSRDVDNVNRYLQPIIDDINTLRQDADKLFESIIDKYPEASKEQLIKVFTPHMKKIDDKFNFD